MKNEIAKIIVETVNKDNELETHQRKSVLLEVLESYFNKKQAFNIFTESVGYVR